MQESPLLGFWQGKEIEASGVSVVLLLPVCAMIFCGTATVLSMGVERGWDIPFHNKARFVMLLLPSAQLSQILVKVCT